MKYFICYNIQNIGTQYINGYCTEIIQLMYNTHLIDEINVDFMLHQLFENEVNRRRCINSENIIWSIPLQLLLCLYLHNVQII